MANSSVLSDSRTLQTLMQRAGISSFRALSAKAGVSRWQVQQFRAGKTAQMRLAVLLQLARALEISLAELLSLSNIAVTGGDEGNQTPLKQASESVSNSASADGFDRDTAPLDRPEPREPSAPDQLVKALRKEYAQLQSQMDHQADQVKTQLQQEALQTLESWLTYWPTAVHKVTQGDPVQAKALLPLVKPVEILVRGWGVIAIATVGAEISYDPQQHQLIKGTAQPGDLVKVRNVGYRYQDKLLHRAKVSPV